MPHFASLALEVIIRNDGRIVGRCLLRRGRYVIGQDPKNEIVVDADSISARHARLTVLNETEFTIEDLESANGTYVDGRSAEQPQNVTIKSKVTLGTATLEFQRGGIPASVFLHLPHSCLRFPRYRLGEIAVQGRTSVIYNAHDTALGRDIAIKVLMPASQMDDKQVIRFIRDAQIGGQLQHSGVLPIYDFGIDDEGRLFSVTRFVEGEPLSQELDAMASATGAEHTLAELIGFFQKVCSVIAYAHSRGVVHGGLNPSAITVGPYGEAFVGGWGNARILPPPDAVTSVVKAPNVTVPPALNRYTPPEQAEGSHDSIDERTDIHALGAILYRIITLRDTLTGDTDEELLDQALSPRVAPSVVFAKQPPCPHWHNGKLPEYLAAVAMKAMSVMREERQQSVRALQKEINAWQEGIATGGQSKIWKQFSGILGMH